MANLPPGVSRAEAIDQFTKQILAAKSKSDVDRVVKKGKPILRLINRDEFTASFLPTTQRAVLRNPEIALGILIQSLEELQLDLSDFALDIGKILGGQLHSKDDEIREWAITGSLNLARQCSDSSGVEKVLRHYFAIFNGSEGKLTVINQRFGVLSGIGALSNHRVTNSDSAHELSAVACELFISILKSEVHEGTLIHAASQMQLWCVKLSKELPAWFIDWFKSSSNLKTSTSLVKAANIACLNAAFKESMISKAGDILPVLSPAAQKSFTATVAQAPVVIEGLQASLLILKLNFFDNQLESKTKIALTGIAKTDTLPYFNEKFISVAAEDTLLTLVSFIESLYLEHEGKLGGRQPALEKALILLMTHPCSHVVRKKAKVACKKIQVAVNDIGINLNESFAVVFATSLHVPSVSGDEKEAVAENAIKPHYLFDCLREITFTSPSNKDRLVLSSFHAAHLPVVYDFNGKTWITLLKHTFGERGIEGFISKNVGNILNLVDKLTVKSVKRNGIKTLVKYFSENFVSAFIQKSVLSLNNGDLHITRQELDIFHTPEGELYDSNSVEIHREEAKMNIKRESKLYSYKEQMADIELRKELEAKQKAKGQVIEPQLNKKQLEAKKLQLDKESAVREKVRVLKNEFDNALEVLEAVAEGNPTAVSFEVAVIIPCLMRLLSSALCAPRAASFYVELSRCIFNLEPELRVFGMSIGYVTLRQLKPACGIDEAWTQEPLQDAIKRIISTLYKRTCRPTGRDYDEKSALLAIEQRLTAPAFAYLFPLLASILQSPTTPEEFLIQCLQIIGEHAQIRERVYEDIELLDSASLDVLALKNPQYLPRMEMISALIKLIARSPIQIEQVATKVLLEVASSASGELGCATATRDEASLYLHGLESELKVIRLVCLKSLRTLSSVLTATSKQSPFPLLERRVYVASFDPEEKCAITARDLWTTCKLDISPQLVHSLLTDVEKADASLRHSVAGAVEALLTVYPDECEAVVTELIVLFKKHCKAPPAILDAFGRPTGAAQVDYHSPRLGVALIFTRIAPLLPSKSIIQLANFFVPEALGDRKEVVQNQILEAGISIVDIHGKREMNSLLEIFQKYLDEAVDSLANDDVRRSVVILMGTLARHLDRDDPKVKPIVAKLIESLSTPSQIVQEAVANCLPHLIPSFKDEAPNIVHSLMQLLLESESYGERKGAAYGIAGLVKGLGILSLKQLGIMDTLTEAIQDKKNPSRREGALFAFEMLCNMLGRLFEPYVIHILPNLLLCFGDTNQRVRKATDDTSKVVMSKLSAHGVKLVLPSLLDALDEDSWRTKAGSIELLGAMAYCAPKQLSSCLPSIVPKLMTVLSDSHPKVQAAGAQALKQIGSVIRNPEIQAIVPVLLEALQDPANKTPKCLNMMLNTKFVHFIDAPSLALIMPVIERAFQGRSTETRKMAAQIIGNMYSLTDQKDLSPYLPSIVPGLKMSLLDPVPEVRAVTARALGAMVKGMGENISGDLIPWLQATLISEASSVDRSGAAQGLSEVIGGLGLKKLEELMPDMIIKTEGLVDKIENGVVVRRVDPFVRDGHIMLFIYLPMVFTQDFTPFIGRIINPVLRALADESEFVRETALKAGQRIVNMYADTAIQLLLPELEQGLFNENWRIRYSSVQLLGDLLYKISGVSGKMTTETVDEDDNFGTEQSYKAIINSLGPERRNRVLSGLYMGRSDVALSVRQAALHVWKVVVTNTPRTLKEILPTLFSLLLGCLASASDDKQQVAARTLGDLVKKLGERVLPEIIPILEQGLESDRPDQRQGVCIGLSEIIASTSREMVQAFTDSLVPTVARALYDPLPEVRQAAAKTFDSLHSAVGIRALDEILPPLLKQLGDPVLGERTLDGLRQVMAIKSRVVLPYLVPQLTAPPANTRALALLSGVAGDALSKHLSKILPALLQSLGEALDGPKEVKEIEYCQTVILAVTDEQGARVIVDYLLESARHESTIERRAAVTLLYAFCCQTKSPISYYVSQLLRGLILLFTDSNEQVLALSWDALNSVTKSLDTKEQIEYVSDVRSAVRYAASDLRNSTGRPDALMPGFCLAKGIAPILPVFREAVLNGNPDQKESAANGLSEVIQLTSAEALKPSVVNIAGPLIRILGDRYAWNVKVAVLDTLSLLLAKVGPQLRPFVPQLQQTFLKALSDNHRQVRLRAANALSHLIQVHMRCDPVFQEIHNSFRTANTEDPSIRETALYALRVSITPAGDKISDAVRKQITMSITSLIGSSEDNVRIASAGCLGALTKWYPDEELAAIAKDYLVEDDANADWTIRHGKSVALRVALKEAPQRIVRQEWIDKISKSLLAYMTSDRIPLVTSGVKGTAYFLDYHIKHDMPLPTALISTFARSMNHNSNEVKQVVATSAIFLTRSSDKALPLTLSKPLVPMLVNGTKEKNTMVKAHSEQALVSVLRLRQSGDDTASELIAALDPGARESLQDCISKVLKKIASQAEPKEEEFDDTLIV